MDARFRHISTLIVKVTHRCNLDCLYCYEHITKTGEDMRLETFFNLTDKVMENSLQPEILFLFHGGEPMLLKNEWYEQAIEYAQSKAKIQAKMIKFSIQTNLLGLTDAKIDLCKKHHINLGVSLDGTNTAKDSMRGGEHKVFENYWKCKNAGIQAGILTTINHSNYDKFAEICEFLVNQAQVNSFKANVVTSVGRGFEMEALQAAQIFEAQHSILEYMIATKGEKLLESNLATEIVRFFASEEERNKMPATLCNEKRCGAGSSVLGITPNGDLLPCGRFQWDDKAYFLGNLEQNNTLIFGEKVNQFHDLVPQTWYDCATCEAKRVCSFGCQAFIVRSKAKANVDCLPTKMRYAFYQQNKKKLLPLLEAIQHKTERQALHFKIKDKAGNEKVYQINSASKPKKKFWQKWFGN